MKKRMAILMSMAIAANMIASVPVCAADIFTDSMTTDSAITQEADDDSYTLKVFLWEDMKSVLDCIVLSRFE